MNLSARPAGQGPRSWSAPSSRLDMSPNAPHGGNRRNHSMIRLMSSFAQHKTQGDKLAEAEATYGREVESVMGPGPDVHA